MYKSEFFSNFISDKAFEFIDKSGLTKSIDSNLTNSIESEAKHCSTDKVWSSLLRVLGLYSVIGMKIQSLYPEYGHDKYKIIFNQLLNPRNIATDLQVNILWSNISPDKANYTHTNHIVPIVINHKVSSQLNQKDLKQSRIIFSPVVMISSSTLSAPPTHLLQRIYINEHICL